MHSLLPSSICAIVLLVCVWGGGGDAFPLTFIYLCYSATSVCVCVGGMHSLLPSSICAIVLLVCVCVGGGGGDAFPLTFIYLCYSATSVCVCGGGGGCIPSYLHLSVL